MPTPDVQRSLQLHPLTAGWANRVRLQSGTIPEYKLSAIDQFVKGLVNLGLYSDNASSKIQYLLIFSATSEFVGCNVPLIDTCRAGNAVLNNYTSASWSDSGLSGNETNAFVNTKWSPSLSPMLSSGNGHFLVWKTVKNATLGANGAAGADVNSGDWALGVKGVSFEVKIHGSATAENADVSVANDVVGCHLISRINTSLLYRRDGVLIANNSFVSGVGNVCTVPLLLHAFNDSNIIGFYNSDRIFCNSLGDGLSANQCGEYFNVLALLKNRLGA